MGARWAADGGIWFSGGGSWRVRSVWRGRPSGPPREVYRGPGNLGIADAFADGRALIAQGVERVATRLKPPEGEAEREIGVFNWTWVVDLSADGSAALVCEGDSPGRPRAVTYLAGTGGGAPVRLGEGTPVALSPGGTRALIAVAGSPASYLLTPTGPGEPRPLLGPFDRIYGAWFLDESRLLVDAASGEGASATFLTGPSGTRQLALTPLGVNTVRHSHREGTVIGLAADGSLARYPLEGGAPRPLGARVPAGFAPLRASGDGRFVFLGRVGMPYRIDRLDLATGQIVPWRSLRPEDLTGATHVLAATITPDGKGYAYTYGRYFHDLYLFEGLRP
jgi:hypothetical protein